MKILSALKIVALTMFLLSEILILAFKAIDAGNLDAGYLSPLRGPAHFIFFSFLAALLAVIIYRSN